MRNLFRYITRYKLYFRIFAIKLKRQRPMLTIFFKAITFLAKNNNKNKNFIIQLGFC